MDMLKDFMISTMTTYKTAFEEGRKVGFKEGHKKANEEILEIINRDKKSEG